MHKLILLGAALLAAPSFAQTLGGSIVIGASPSVVPLISDLALSPSATTIVATWKTNVQSDSKLACGTSPGSYTQTALDGGTENGVLRHQAIVSGLLPSTTYYCQVSSTDSTGTQTATASIATAATAATTPITGVSYSTFTTYNNAFAPNTGVADTFYNTRAADGKDYITNDDTSGWNGGYNSSVLLGVLSGTWPSVIKDVNGFTGYGLNGGCVVQPENLSFKDSGLLAMDGKLFMATGRQKNSNCAGYVTGAAFTQAHGEIMWSPDHGQSWNTYQGSTTFDLHGIPTTAAMFPTSPSNWASATFVMYGGDDGTLGYLNPANRHDNGEAWVYLVANEGYWNNGSNYYLARVARAKLAHLQASDYQYFTGGDGNLDGNWTGTAANATPILSAANQLSETNVQYIPALNRYVMLTYYYPAFSWYSISNTSPANHSTWVMYESPHPWGPWTSISTSDWPTQGYYNPVILQSSALSGTAPTIFFTGSFGSGSTYLMYYATMNLNHN